MHLFKSLGCPYPPTQIWSSAKDCRAAWRKTSAPRPFPFCIKQDNRHEARGVFVIRDEHSLEKALSHLERCEEREPPGFVSQDLIHTEGNVLRVVLIGRQTLTYWKRPVEPDQIITTLSRGAAIDQTWRPDLQYKGRPAVRRLKVSAHLDLAAIDLICDLNNRNPEPLFLEINYFFGRRGLGGGARFYRFLHQEVRQWVERLGLNSSVVCLY